MSCATKIDERERQVGNASLKKEETSLTVSVTEPCLEMKAVADSKSPQIRIVRGTKKLKVDNNDCTNCSEKKDSKEEDNAEAKMRSLKRSCELWSLEDKNTFFKALNEYGKDFDALQNYFQIQGKRKGLSDIMIKNKEQIRHFYYRTWLKISKHLKFSEDVKKTSQELYGLINYGELRRKLPRIHEKVHLKLNELIYWGSTQVRLRGKTMRIKTPICKALRKLNQLEDWQEEIKLPSRVTVELRPRNNMAWWKVQASSMNPRVRTLLPMQRRLSSLLIFLQQRWQPLKYKTYINTEIVNLEETKDARLLRVAPPEGCKIALPMVNLGEYLTSNSVSLDTYEKRLGLKSSRTELLGAVQCFKGVNKRGIKRYRLDKKCLERTTSDQSAPIDNNSDVDLGGDAAASVCDKSAILNNEKKHTVEQALEPNRFPGRETVDRIRRGWNIDEANTMTMGDLFLMLYNLDENMKVRHSMYRKGSSGRIFPYYLELSRRDDAEKLNAFLTIETHSLGKRILLIHETRQFGRESKITLEYWWDSHPPKQHATDNALEVTTDDNLSLALKKLVFLAKHNYGTNKVYDNASGSNETVISSRVLSIKESPFRRPLIPQTYNKIGTSDAFKTQLDKFKTRFSKKGRTVRQKSLIVQRVVPITSTVNVQTENVILSDTPTTSQNSNNNLGVDASVIQEDKITEVEEQRNKNFLPMDGIESETNPKPTNSIITSATQILKEGEWLTSEVVDFSLSSFLGQLESPLKGSQRSQVGVHHVEDVRTSSDVVSHMQCLMGENSVDYMAKFANLASQIADDENKAQILQ